MIRPPFIESESFDSVTFESLLLETATSLEIIDHVVERSVTESTKHTTMSVELITETSSGIEESLADMTVPLLTSTSLTTTDEETTSVSDTAETAPVVTPVLSAIGNEGVDSRPANNTPVVWLST